MPLLYCTPVSAAWPVLATDADCAALRDSDRVRIATGPVAQQGNRREATTTATTTTTTFGDYLLRIPAEHITDLEKFHTSPTSELFRGRWRSTPVVIKRFHMTANQGRGRPEVEEGLRRELDVIGRLRHPCLLTLYGVTGASHGTARGNSRLSGLRPYRVRWPALPTGVATLAPE
jgi:hypothetical protein